MVSLAAGPHITLNAPLQGPCRSPTLPCCHTACSRCAVPRHPHTRGTGACLRAQHCCAATPRAPSGPTCSSWKRGPATSGGCSCRSTPLSLGRTVRLDPNKPKHRPARAQCTRASREKASLRGSCGAAPSPPGTCSMPSGGSCCCCCSGGGGSIM